jgi:non-homologous end joining protein Ku
MSRARMNTRSEHVTLNCQLLTLAVDIYGATTKESAVTRHKFTTDDHPIGNGIIDKTQPDVIYTGEIIMKTDTPDGPVFIADHEIEALCQVVPKTITVKEFQPEALFLDGTYVAKTLYSVEPSKIVDGKRKVDNPNAQKAWTAILAGMKAEGALAVVEVVTRGTPKPGVLLSDGTLWIVYSDDQIREKRPVSTIDVPPELAEQGRALVQSMWGTEPLDLTDTRSAAIQEFANAKAAAGNFGETEAPVLVETPAPEPVDLIALMAASIAAAKNARAA